MKASRFTIILIILLSVFIWGCKQGPWAEYSPDSGGFTVMLPGTPEISTRTETPGPMVTVNTTEHVVPAKMGRFGGRYTVSVSEISAPNLDSTGWQDAFITGAKGGIAKEGFKISSETKVTLGEHTGWEFESTSPTTDSTIRIFIVGARIYALELARKKGNDMTEEREKFFNSFAIE